MKHHSVSLVYKTIAKILKMNNKNNLCYKIVFLLLLICYVNGHAEMQTDTITFSFEGKRYVGFIDMPKQKTPRSLIVILPGSGKTYMAENGFYHNLRTHFTEQGFACLIWDKAGCGKSDGVFDYNQTVQSSASEVIAAITECKSRHMPALNRSAYGASAGQGGSVP